MTWEEYDYRLALIYVLWRAMPAPPSAKDKEHRAIWEHTMENAIRIPAREILNNPPTGAQKRPFPKDPVYILLDPVDLLWKNFIDHLNATQPLSGGKGKHKSFLGSIESYRKVFLDANK